MIALEIIVTLHFVASGVTIIFFSLSVDLLENELYLFYRSAERDSYTYV